jgi:hypothetical protein
MNTETDTQQTSRDERRIPFAALQARVGERLQLLVPRYSQGRPFMSALVGWIENEFLLVRRPVDGTSPAPLVAGDNVTVRLFTGTDVAEFATSVQRVFGAGLPYCHLDYPKLVKALTLRAEPRVSVDLPGVVAVPGGEGEVAVRVRDINTRGVRVQASAPFGAPGARVSLRVSPADGEEAVFSIDAEIRSVRPLSADELDGPCSCGLKFDDLTDEQRAFLRDLLDRAG